MLNKIVMLYAGALSLMFKIKMFAFSSTQSGKTCHSVRILAKKTVVERIPEICIKYKIELCGFAQEWHLHFSRSVHKRQRN